MLTAAHGAVVPQSELEHAGVAMIDTIRLSYGLSHRLEACGRRYAISGVRLAGRIVVRVVCFPKEE